MMKNAIRLLKMFNNNIGGADWTLNEDELKLRNEIILEISKLETIEFVMNVND